MNILRVDLDARVISLANEAWPLFGLSSRGYNRRRGSDATTTAFCGAYATLPHWLEYVAFGGFTARCSLQVRSILHVNPPPVCCLQLKGVGGGGWLVKNEAYDDFCHPSTAKSFKSHTQLVILAPLFLCTRKRQKNKLHTWLPTFSSSFYTWDLMALYPETLSYSLTTNFLLLHGANWGDWSVSHVAKYKKKNAQNRKVN